MTDIKNKVQNLDPNVKARNIKDMVRPTGNMFEALVAISKRANQISNQLKRELHTKLEEFSVTSDTIEEIHENKEQIEISKFYERLPNPAIIATEEYLNGELVMKYRDEENA
ncbi:MAG: DNA-directed RNA polymerase subunit omega [Saprospiraceae bacterium]|jgi:DNA-directed RNA polymerase subunit K/omega|nr:DNA-directed RNA polymerase subunit omega [Saprospiraceae bacterium]